jgi:hypothetical protein
LDSPSLCSDRDAVLASSLIHRWSDRAPFGCMSKRNWVCFDCRSVVRREAYTVDSVVCATCSEPRVNLGYKITIPAKTRAKDWESLREQYFASQRAAARVRREAEPGA